ncbi:MAG: hypothetical protein ACREPZ_09830 [Rhodanobacteraceae bacterium]
MRPKFRVITPNRQNESAAQSKLDELARWAEALKPMRAAALRRTNRTR